MTALAHAVREAAGPQPFTRGVHPLNLCGCPHFHDQSASCAAVADAHRRNARRAHWTDLLTWKDEA